MYIMKKVEQGIYADNRMSTNIGNQAFRLFHSIKMFSQNPT